MKLFSKIFSGVLLATPLAFLSSCSMMTEDIDDCPTGLFVRYVYDYNTQRADMFKDHVGHVTLYVYNEAGDKVAERSVSNTADNAPLSQYGYTTHFKEGELPDGKYRLQAVAMQKDWDDALAAPGAKYRRNVPARHDELSIRLDYDNATIPGTEYHLVSKSAPLDTLWHTLKVQATEPMDGRTVPAPLATRKPYSVYPLEEQYVTVQHGRATYATVSLIRDTKHLNITMRQLDFPANIFDEDFDVYITDKNSTVGHDNALTSDAPLRYEPFHAWTTRFDQGGVSIETGNHHESEPGTSDLQRTAHYNIMFNRLMHRSSRAEGEYEGAKLMIVRRETGKTVAEMDLAEILAEGRTAYETFNYTPQEYLDREYDYHLDFLLRGDDWVYCDIVINVLSWSKRKQNEQL